MFGKSAARKRKSFGKPSNKLESLSGPSNPMKKTSSSEDAFDSIFGDTATDCDVDAPHNVSHSAPHAPLVPRASLTPAVPSTPSSTPSTHTSADTKPQLPRNAITPISRPPPPPASKKSKTISSFFASVQKPINIKKLPPKPPKPPSSTPTTTTPTPSTNNTTTKTQYYLGENGQNQVIDMHQSSYNPHPLTQLPSRLPSLVNLDFGQKGFNESIKCPICETLYQPTIKAEADNHKKICSSYTLGVPFHTPSKHREILKDLKSGISSTRTAPKNAYLGPSDHVLFRFPDLNSRLRSIKQIVDKEMGFAEESPPQNVAYYVAVSPLHGRAVGFVTAHPLDMAYRMIGYEGNSLLSRSKETKTVKIGVHQMWTHSTSRGLGICTALIDKARETMIYGHDVGKGEVAFSSPTGDGVALAGKYKEEGGQVYVYDC